MKKLTVFIPVLLLFTISFAPDYVPTPDEVNRFYQTKTLAILEDNPISPYNFVIKEFMEKEWKLNAVWFYKL